VSWVEEGLYETIMFVVLILLNGAVLGLLVGGVGQKPSLERSRELYWRSIAIFFFGLIIVGLWYLFGISVSKLEEYSPHSGFALGASLIAIVVGVRHWRKFREFSQVSMEIEQGLSGETPEE